MRAWKVILGDFTPWYVRTTTRSRARYLAAKSFAEADFGSVGQALALINSCRLHGEHDDGPEGCWMEDGLQATATKGGPTDG